MQKDLISRLASFFVAHSEGELYGTLDEETKETIDYGARLLIYSMIDFAVVLLVGLACHRLIQVIFFLVFFCYLRQQAGGYHAPNAWSCTVSFGIYLWLGIVFLMERPICFAMMIGSFVMTVIITTIAPVEDHNKPLGQMRRQKNKVKSIIVSIIEEIIIFILYLSNVPRWMVMYSSWAIITIGLLLILGLLKNKSKRRS